MGHGPHYNIYHIVLHIMFEQSVTYSLYIYTQCVRPGVIRYLVCVDIYFEAINLFTIDHKLEIVTDIFSFIISYLSMNYCGKHGKSVKFC